MHSRLRHINWSYQLAINKVPHIELRLAMSLPYIPNWLYWIEYSKVATN